MSDYGTLHEDNGRYALRFERYFPYSPGDVFQIVTNPDDFVQWYPFATGEMDLRTGGEIAFDDGEGTVYEAVITELDEPHTFAFREVDDYLQMSLQDEKEGCRLIFIHTFDDEDMIMYVAAGWHRCLDVLSQMH
ncbi:SRPBCC domain-containing protein [Salibacterium aidingense]|uniref:SRPBCC domain-containing protein n=1 Tax=Salibacterium aidingense TaxID=384933 RepID=UPI0004294BFE|nr:SRPBCC domain-containing protein [Salibacterium aidingense]